MSTRDWSLWSCECRLVVDDPSLLDAAGRIADAVLADVDRAISRFRADSEVSELRVGWNDVSPTLADLVREGLVAAWLSDGAVDPTLGSAMSALGYDRDLADVRRGSLVANPDRLREMPTGPTWRRLRLDGRRLYRPAGAQIDLGATGKAAAADRVAHRVHAEVGCGVLVSLGGDIATAGPGPANGWQVTVQDLPSDVPQQVSLSGGAAIATSSTAKRTWEHGGRTHHHVLDPATGAPVSGPWRSVSVVAEDCTRANTAATGALVKGSGATRWLRGLGLPARLVDHTGAVRTLNGFPLEAVA